MMPFFVLAVGAGTVLALGRGAGAGIGVIRFWPIYVVLSLERVEEGLQLVAQAGLVAVLGHDGPARLVEELRLVWCGEKKAAMRSSTKPRGALLRHLYF